MEADAQLLDRARMLDKAALGKIFDLYSSPLYCYALRLCGDPALADHVVGDVFAKLLDQFSSGKGPSANLRSYLYEIAYHPEIAADVGVVTHVKIFYPFRVRLAAYTNSFNGLIAFWREVYIQGNSFG